ncbi:unnamed protein product [Thelazia callipaeda]|uniref:Fungal lipase-type domain-containing protein n=1 Tax=Thelazia callipaeda TaxID=103827 RepID=A0A3P7NEU7_THECL|nr:unnamed protein product [Thelazia callipaeda]
MSLGGALASLAAVRTVVQNLRDGNEIKLVTFGEPRIGDYQFAMYHSTHIPYSFRVVNRADIIPHLPPCKKNASIANSEIDESKPCLATNNSFPYHHGITFRYPYGMHENAKYYECLNTPINEDFECSDSLLFDIKHLKTFIKDHRYYFNVKVPAYGKKGCKNFTNDSSEIDDAFIPLNVSQQLTSDSSSSFQKIQTGISNIFDALKSLIKFF